MCRCVGQMKKIQLRLNNRQTCQASWKRRFVVNHVSIFPFSDMNHDLFADYLNINEALNPQKTKIIIYTSSWSASYLDWMEKMPSDIFFVLCSILITMLSWMSISLFMKARHSNLRKSDNEIGWRTAARTHFFNLYDLHQESQHREPEPPTKAGHRTQEKN